MGALVRWFLQNRVAANLLMVGLVVAGIASALQITVRTFPEITPTAVTVEVAYPGATPSEVADAILTPIEEQLLGLEGVRKLTSTATEGLGVVNAEFTRGADVSAVKDDIETEIAQITTFPTGAEDPRIAEVDRDELAIQLAITGDRPLPVLKAIAEEVRDTLSGRAGISRAEIAGAPVDQIEITIRREVLRSYGVGLSELADRIGADNVDLSAGVLDTGESEIQLRTAGESETADGFRDLVLFTGENGARVRLSDIAEVTETFAEEPVASAIDGEPVVFVSVYRVGSEQVLAVVDRVQTYLEDELRPTLPEDIDAFVWRDEGETLSSRIELLAKNGAIGVSLILIILMLFLDLRIAAWVAAGVVVAFVGAFALMLVFGITINQLSLFGFILALGIVVDDAIVVGENVYSELESGDGDAGDAARKGVERVWPPILFSVSTTIFAFVPLLFLPGSSGSFIAPVAAVVIFVLLVSMTESFFILPTHLSHIRIEEPRRFSPRRITEPVRARIDRAFRRFSNGPLRRIVDFAIAFPAFVIACTVAIFIAAAGLVAGGVVKFVFFPEIEGNFVTAELVFPEGTSDAETRARAEALVDAARRAADDVGAENLLQSVAVTLGFQTEEEGPLGSSILGGNTARIEAKLLDANQRDIAAEAFLRAWREAAGEVPGAKELTFSASVVGIGEPIVLDVSADTEEARDDALGRIRQALTERPGVFDIRDDRFSPAEEIRITLTPAASVYGVTLQTIANELRAAFYGAVIDQFARSREEVDVRLRLPEEERDSIADLLKLRIPSGDGLIPLGLVAQLEWAPAPTTITRIDGRTVATLTADVDETVTTGGAETGFIQSEVVPQLAADYPGLEVTAGGEQEESSRFGSALQFNFMLALFAIYALLALAFSSYVRPLIVLLVIPFGFVGALLGHALLGLNLTLLSMFGIIGLSGVIVNGALLIVDFIIAGEAEGKAPADAIRDATLSRFRPIMLTTLTTFLGIAPLILETSVQAQFLIPTAVSLGFGVLFASLLQMVLVPALASLYARLRGEPRRLPAGAPQPAE